MGRKGNSGQQECEKEWKSGSEKWTVVEDKN